MNDYNSKMDELLEEIPSEFHSFISYWAYEYGHAYGEEEMIGIARDLVYNLKPAIKEFGENIVNIMKR